MINASQIVRGDLSTHQDEAWNMRKVMWHIYDLAMERAKEVPQVPGWKMKFVRSKAQVITFYREGQNKDLGPVLRDLEEKEKLFKGTIFEPYFNAIVNVAVADYQKFIKEGGGKWDGQGE